MHTLPEGIGWPLVTNVIRRGLENHTFGMVRRNRDGSPRAHQGWDFYSEPGYRCYAIADGKVVAVRNTSGYGKHVVMEFQFDLDNDGGVDTLYAAYCHLSRVDVQVGQKLRLGDQIGLTGNSGNARSMRGKDQHLHFEIRRQPITGRGLKGRLSPFRVFGKCPKRPAVVHDGPFNRL